MITIYDQNRNPNMNNRDHLVGRTRTAAQPRTCAGGDQKEQFCQTVIGIRSSRCLFVDMSIIGRTTKDTVLII